MHPEISRDFIYTDDAIEAFVNIALNLTEADYGESFNVGTGRKTTIGECAELAQEIILRSGCPCIYNAQPRMGSARLVRER